MRRKLGGRRIEGICAVSGPDDVPYTQCCVASIRHFYPEIPIYLFKDRRLGDYDTSELESACRVELWPTDREAYGWGWAKLEILSSQPSRRLLILDSDIVLAGPLLRSLEVFEEDFVVVLERFTPESQREFYYDLAKLQLMDPDWVESGMNFNSGQFVATTGLMNMRDFDPWVGDTPEWHLKQPEVFKCNDQGLLNYLLSKWEKEGRLTLRRHSFMQWANGNDLPHLTPESMAQSSLHRVLVHWAGTKSVDFSTMPNGRLLEFYRGIYQGMVAQYRKRMPQPVAS
ncbi:MAG: hypothetical protein SFU85_13085 [Candidatus Methylacidiphilales bacterium]|nr:hypothetical protein [Candidatus Methylacidiphilales bacterium]